MQQFISLFFVFSFRFLSSQAEGSKKKKKKNSSTPGVKFLNHYIIIKSIPMNKICGKKISLENFDSTFSWNLT